MNDPTEMVRREMVETINREPGSRIFLEHKYGQVWSTEELTSDFSVIGFLAPFVLVKRRGDNQEGSLEFQANPRFYFNFVSSGK